MASSSDNISMAVFCDFENVALGVRDANYEKFDIKPVLERLLLKGSIVVKKAYCDWDRYKGFKSTMHEANFELIEIPHLRQSGKNSADIRLVVDALDLCYTKSHVNTFVIISGDSDFSPLVSKLRENAKQVIGVGVKQSTSDLLVANCDEFIFYDDLVREVRRAAAKRDERKAQPQGKRPGDDRRKEEVEARKAQALEMVVETFDDLVSERGDTGKIWASLLKDTLKRRRPDFSETYYGFRTFGNLLEEAQSRGLFEFGRDEKSGTYVFRSNNEPPPLLTEQVQAAPEPVASEPVEEAPAALDAKAEAKGESRRRGRGGRKQGRGEAEAAHEDLGANELAAQQAAAEIVERAARPAERTREAADAEPAGQAAAPVNEARAAADGAPSPAAPATGEAAAAADVPAAAAKERRRTPRKPAAKKAAQAAPTAENAAEAPAPASEPAPAQAAPTPPAKAEEAAVGPADNAGAGAETGDEGDKPAKKRAAKPAHKAPARKAPAGTRRAAKPKTAPENG